MKFEENLIRLRKSRGRSQEDLADKLNVSAQMADRGLMTRNEIRDIWNLAPLPEPYGSQLPIRGEYYNVGEEEASAEGEEDNTNEG